MTAALAAVHVVLGFVYLQYGTMTALEMRRNWRRMGFSHFGAAWIAMAFTCGPHHLAHGLHVATGENPVAIADLVVAAVGLPAGVIWFALRVEAFLGRRGDRFIAGAPLWVLALPTLAGMYVTALASAGIARGGVEAERLVLAAPSAGLVVLYLLVSFYVTRTQVANRPALGGFSLSGLALGAIFLTCAVMHATYGFLLTTGTYVLDWHLLLVDLLSLPAAAYFVGVVRALHSGAFRDWNRTGDALDAAAARARPALADG